MRATLERAYEDSLSAYARAQQEPPSVVQRPYVEPLGVARLRAAAGLFDAPAPAPPVRRTGKEPISNQGSRALIIQQTYLGPFSAVSKQLFAGSRAEI